MLYFKKVKEAAMQKFLPVFFVIILGLTACGSAYTTPPIPVREANPIMRDIMSTLRDEVEDAQNFGALQESTAYTNAARTAIVSGTVSLLPSENKTVINATVVMTSLQTSANAYTTTGTISYDDTLNTVSGARTTEYKSEGTFTLEKGLESWECRWPKLGYARVPTSDDGMGGRTFGSYVINGVTYSYTGNTAEN
jgi:hypothetical protein